MNTSLRGEEIYSFLSERIFFFLTVIVVVFLPTFSAVFRPCALLFSDQKPLSFPSTRMSFKDEHKEPRNHL